MQRRHFVRTVAVSLPLLACAPLRQFGPSTARAVVVKAGESRFGVPTPFLGVNPNDLKLSTKDTGGLLSVFEYQGVQKVGPSLHKHLYQDEIFYVLGGEYVFQVGDDFQLLKKGDLIFLPRNVQHTWVQVSEAGKLIYFLQPAGKMEEFFLLMTEKGGSMSPEERVKANEDHGLVPVGPWLEAATPFVFSESLAHGFVVRAGKDRQDIPTKLGGINPNDLKISKNDTQSMLSIFEYSGFEKGGPPLHIHPNQDEIFYVTAGEYLFQCGEDQFTLATATGDLIFLPKNVPHAFAQQSEQGSMLFFFQPSGKMEDFFRELGKIPGTPAPEQGAKLFEDHDMKVVGPPLAIK